MVTERLSVDDMLAGRQEHVTLFIHGRSRLPKQQQNSEDLIRNLKNKRQHEIISVLQPRLSLLNHPALLRTLSLQRFSSFRDSDVAEAVEQSAACLCVSSESSETSSRDALSILPGVGGCCVSFSDDVRADCMPLQRL